MVRLVWNFCLACYLTHKFDLRVIKLFLNLVKSSIKFIVENDGEKSHILPDFLNASISSVKSSVNCSCAQLFFSGIVDIYAGCQFHVLYIQI